MAQSKKHSYRITTYTKRRAKQLGVSVKKSKIKSKKLDVFRNGKKIASVGAIGYNDFPTFIKEKGPVYASKRRALYKMRHSRDRNVKGSPGFWADKLLW